MFSKEVRLRVDGWITANSPTDVEVYLRKCHVMVMNVLFKQMTTKVTTEFSLATSTNDSMDCFHMVKNSKH